MVLLPMAGGVGSQKHVRAHSPRKITWRRAPLFPALRRSSRMGELGPLGIMVAPEQWGGIAGLTPASYWVRPSGECAKALRLSHAFFQCR